MVAQTQMTSSMPLEHDSHFDQHYSHAAVEFDAPAQQVFAQADEHALLASYMTRRSWMTGGGRMSIQSDTGRGKQVGSRLQLEGRMFGIRLAVEEVVTEYLPPHRKVWQTVGTPRLLVVASYRMGFNVTRLPQTTRLEVFIDYSLPKSAGTRWLGVLFGTCYARWCTRKMAMDLAAQFSRP